MRYRILLFDGSNGWTLGEIVTELPAGVSSRNDDGLMESEDGEMLFVPLD